MHFQCADPLGSHTYKVPLACGVHTVQTDVIKVQLCTSGGGESLSFQVKVYFIYERAARDEIGVITTFTNV